MSGEEVGMAHLKRPNDHEMGRPWSLWQRRQPR
jgi:hypothetical protein